MPYSTQEIWGITREKLFAARTYYVDPAGSDSNDGLSAGPSGAFLTIQKAIDITAGLDTDIYDVTIQLADGTYTQTSPLLLKQPIGTGQVILKGNNVTPTNVTIIDDGVVTDGTVRAIGSNLNYLIQDLELAAAHSGNGQIVWTQYGVISWKNVTFTNVGQPYTIRGQTNSVNEFNVTTIDVAGNAGQVFSAENGAILGFNVTTINVNGVPNWSGNGFAVAQRSAAIVLFFSVTINGTATGKRFTADNHGSVNTFGGGAAFLPGNVAGTADAPTFALYQ